MKTITFEVEQADRSVGIMSEGFTAWEKNGDCWCNLDDIADNGKFTWFANENGEECKPPHDAVYIEMTLLAFAKAYYVQEEALVPRMYPEEGEGP